MKKRKFVSPILQSSSSITLKKEKTGFDDPLSKDSNEIPLSSSKFDPSIDKIFKKYFCIMYRVKKKNSKGKGPWLDGVLIVEGRFYTLFDSKGKVITKTEFGRCNSMNEGASFEMGKHIIEIMSESSMEEFNKGILFTKTNSSSKNISFIESRTPALPLKKFSKQSLLDNLREDSLILNTVQLKSKKVFFPVVVDQYIAKNLRPHQREGIVFMYECIMGFHFSNCYGCLLADEMGLGKTIQVIALIWTLLKQGPRGIPVIKRSIVVCPSSLVSNWEKEIKRWLGMERIKPLVVNSNDSSDEVKSKFFDFSHGLLSPLLITSYDLLRRHVSMLSSAKADLLVCDEGHRLKNAGGNKTIQSLQSLHCERKIILTGTPVQNDLNEFYALLNFVCPNVLGTLSAFSRVFTHPIQKGKDRNASEEEKQLGMARSKELAKISSQIVLQRTAEINKAYLPNKQVFVVFCKLEDVQIELYEKCLQSNKGKAFLYHSFPSTDNPLTVIMTLRKICNSPSLVPNDLIEDKNDEKHKKFKTKTNGKYEYSLQNKNKNDYHDFKDGNCNEIDEESIFLHSPLKPWETSGKLLCLFFMLNAIRKNNDTEKNEIKKVVIVSNFTQTLDIIQEMCTNQGWRFCRLDGRTDVSTRSSIVHSFNTKVKVKVKNKGEISDEESTPFLFLLSAKAGGVGLNLIGANRLILLDPDWNPATDLQAMARIWREGQSDDVFIYRFLSTGSIEEKIYQRQIMKGDVASSISAKNSKERHGNMNTKNGGLHFSHEELKELFTLHKDTNCDTYDRVSRYKDLSIGASWQNHIHDVDDFALEEAIRAGKVSFVHKEMDHMDNDFISNFNHEMENEKHEFAEADFESLF